MGPDTVVRVSNTQYIAIKSANISVKRGKSMLNTVWKITILTYIGPGYSRLARYCPDTVLHNKINILLVQWKQSESAGAVQ